MLNRSVRGLREVQWFGPARHAPMEDLCEQVPTPVGDPCVCCGTVVREGDDGVLVDGYENLPNFTGYVRRPWLMEHFLRNVGVGQ